MDPNSGIPLIRSHSQSKNIALQIPQSDEYRKQRISPFFKQIFTVAGIIFQKMSCGAAIGFTAILFPDIMAAGSQIPTSKNSASWIMSLYPVGSFVMCFVSPLLMKKYGRKITQQVGCVIMAVAWITLGTSTNSATIFLARLLQGFSNGIQMALLPIYISEISSPRNRGLFLGSASLSVSLGKLLSHLLGTIFYWKTAAFACSIIPITSLVVISFTPETPNWLASKEKYEDSKKSFIWLRGFGVKSQSEMEIFIAHKMKENEATQQQGNHNIFKNIIKTLAKKEVYKAFFIMYIMYLAYMSTMNEFLGMYIINLLQEVAIESKESYYIMNTMDTVRILSSVMSLFLIKKFNRRSIYFSSGLSTSFMLATVSLYLYLAHHNYFPPSAMVINVLLNLAVVMMSSGVLPLAFIYAGELFPLDHKEVAAFASAFCGSTTLFVVLKTSVYIIHYLNVSGFFLFYAVVLLACLIILSFILPETRDKTLVELSHIETTAKS